MIKPELLSPAGNLEKLKIAFNYGADAVFVGGNVFGLRKYADNFSLDELKEGIAFANERNKQVYLVLNGFAHQSDIEALKPYLDQLQAIQPNAFIISDMGVLQLAKTRTNIPLHVSTQASVTNVYACKLWKDAGAKRVILAREVSIEDCKTILKHCDIELETFVHGAMCASYSGKCVISNYTSGRDSNRGGCIQSCRHNYHILDSERDLDTTLHIMNAKDLNGITLLPQLMESGIASLKIEGRMKSNLYLANVTSAYRKAIDFIWENPNTSNSDLIQSLSNQLSDVSNRQFSTGGLDTRPDSASINQAFGHYEKKIEFVGTVKSVNSNHIILDVKTSFSPQDTLGIILQKNGERVQFSTPTIQTISGDFLQKTNPNSLAVIPGSGECQKAEPLDVVYKLLV